MSVANILKTPPTAPSITSAYADGSGGGGGNATSTQIFDSPIIPTNTYTFISPTTGSYIIEMTFICSTGVITAPAGSYAGFVVPGVGTNDYGATISGISLTSAVSPLTIISFTITSTHDFIAGVSNSITVYNNGIDLNVGGGSVLEVTGPL